MGDVGGPAMTTTSFLAPFPARLALLFLPCALLVVYIRNVPVPKKANIATVTALCRETQPVTRPTKVPGTTTGGGALYGLRDSGIKCVDDRKSFMLPATFSNCLSVASKIPAVNFRTSDEMPASCHAC